MEYYGYLFWLTIIGGTVYMVWSAMRARRWQRQARCARCGAVDPTRTVGGTRDAAPLCDRCAAKTERNHQLGYRFFLGMSIFFGIVTVIITLGEMYNGVTIDWPDTTLTFSIAVGPPGAFALLIRFMSRS